MIGKWAIAFVVVIAAAPVRAEPEARPRSVWAAGAGVSAYTQADRTLGYVPELVGYLYVPLTDRWFIRPGARLAFRGLDQSEMAGALALEERDVGGAAEAAITYSGRVVPSLAIGTTLAYRTISTSAAAPIDASQSLLDRSELLPGLHVQLSAGLPVSHGRLMIEPFVRYEYIPDDRRLGMRWGLELTVALAK